MTQMEINRAVALATGESAREIRRLGFSLAETVEQDFDPSPGIGRRRWWIGTLSTASGRGCFPSRD